MYEMSAFWQSQKGSLVKRVDSLLGPLVRDLGIEDGLRLVQVKKNWHTLFNEPLSSHMTPYKLTQGALLLNVDSSVWLQELNYFKKDIIEKLTPYGINDIRFKLGKVSKKTESGVCDQGYIIKTLTPEEVSYIEKTVCQVMDEELKGTVRRAIEKSISSRQTK